MGAYLMAFVNPVTFMHLYPPALPNQFLTVDQPLCYLTTLFSVPLPYQHSHCQKAHLHFCIHTKGLKGLRIILLCCPAHSSIWLELSIVAACSHDKRALERMESKICWASFWSLAKMEVRSLFSNCLSVHLQLPPLPLPLPALPKDALALLRPATDMQSVL